jgi:hypothetical protein
MDTIHGGHLRAVEFSQLVQRLIPGDAFGAQPTEQGFECRLTSVLLIADSFRLTIALDHEPASCPGSPAAEQFQDLRLNRKHRGAFVGFERMPLGRFDVQCYCREIEAVPFQQINFFASKTVGYANARVPCAKAPGGKARVATFECRSLAAERASRKKRSCADTSPRYRSLMTFNATGHCKSMSYAL